VAWHAVRAFDAAGPLISRSRGSWGFGYPLIVQAVNKLKVRSCLIDGEAVCCNEHGVPSYEKLRHRSND